jgi:glycosyltransferase involved in cell wall biosynthesis
MKIYTNKIKESWIIDRISEEWYKNNRDISTKKINESDIIWIIASWTWKKIPKKVLSRKKVIASIYHIDFKAFGYDEKKDFYEMDKYVDVYHVISLKTEEQLKKLTNKKIISIPFWVNQKNWYHIENKSELRTKWGIGANDYLVGSFQRDTEGTDLESPKLIKGPDSLINILKGIKENNKKLVVILAGTRRQYVLKNLKKLEIDFKYFEMVDIKELNELYNILDLYIVSSRLEGGPQAILEASITKTPLVSTDVGVASEILHKSSIFEVENFNEATPMTDYAYFNSLKFTIPNGMDKFINMFKDLYEN